MQWISKSRRRAYRSKGSSRPRRRLRSR
jgi:hypothetical protein